MNKAKIICGIVAGIALGVGGTLFSLWLWLLSCI